MSITKKALLERIKSIEDELGLAYIKADNKNDYQEHVKRSYSILNDFKKVFAWYKKSNKTKDED